ncbi:CheR family methyltransferase [Bosea sp. 2KB_26]|uniref:CheR family methyltransferase n=1 Tax=Bosea sp. 2KB_26 TaxID=3237475 RepID=UPI003F8EB70F
MGTGAFEQLLREMIGLSSETVGASVIRHALKRRMTACEMPDLHSYWSYLSENRTERQELIDAVVVPETWFFRDREAFAAMTRQARERRGSGVPLRLLSLPCATGEEPYSMAMALFDAGFEAREFRIDAIDVSTRNLVYAERAVYGRNSFRGEELGYRDRHFDAVDGGFRPHEGVRRQVRFTLGNLRGPAPQPRTDPYDVIFCRNLLIYFDRETQGLAMDRLRQMLADDGLLLVGPAESGLPTLHGFASVRFPRAFAFIKANAVQQAPAAAPARRSRPTPQPAQAPRPIAPPPRVRPFAQKTAPGEAALPAPDRAAMSLATIEHAANAGHLGEVKRAAASHLEEFGPSSEVFYLLGLAYDADDAPSDAIQNYRKALYLAPDHRQALVQLKLLLQRQGDKAGAKALTDRLDRIAKRSDV